MARTIQGRQSSGPNSERVNAARNRLTSMSGRPPEWARLRCWEAEQHMRVEVLERLVLILDLKSRECAWFWQPARGEELRIRNQPGLLRPFDDPNALALLGQSYVRLGARCKSRRMPTLFECQEAMRLELARNPMFRNWIPEWRQLIHSLLGPVLELSERSRAVAGSDLELSDLNRVWRHKSAFFDLANNSPALLPLLNLWFASGQEQECRGPVLGALREVICALPYCGPATWRWLLRWGVSSPLSFVQEMTPDSAPARRWQVLGDLLGLWTRAGLPPPLPTSLARAWARREAPMSSLSNYCPDRLAIFAREIGKNLPSRRLDELADQLITLRGLPNRPDPNQKRSGWKWLDRELRQRCPVIPCSPAALDSLRQGLPEEVVASGVRFVHLSTPAELFEEGRNLGHCMADHPLEIARSGDLHYSLREIETDDRIGTLSVKPCRESLVLKELAGPGNSAPTRRLLSAALALGRVLATPRQLP